MSQFTFSSSAIESISDVQDGKVTITFNGGRDYTYGVQDVEMFVSQLSAVIANQQSSIMMITLRDHKSTTIMIDLD